MEKNIGALPEVHRDMWDRLSAETRPIMIYGMGNGAEKLLWYMKNRGLRAREIFASDGFVRGQYFQDYKVRSFSEIQENYKNFVILLAFGSRRPEVLSAIYKMAESHFLLVPDLPVAGDEYFTSAFYNQNKLQLEKTLDLLSDDLSRQIFLSVIRYKLTGELSYLRAACNTEKECYDCLSDRKIDVAVDGGAYNGDTVFSLLTYRPEIGRVIAVEPDRRNFEKLKRYAATDPYRIQVHYGALWSKSGNGYFSASGNRNSTLQSTASHQVRRQETALLTVDELTSGLSVDYIKYDVEGAELQALQGSRATILHHRPALAVSLYHRSEDLFRIPLLLHSWNPDYRFYLRRTECLPAWEIMLYAI